jgi:hypothetical protein
LGSPGSTFVQREDVSRGSPRHRFWGSLSVGAIGDKPNSFQICSRLEHSTGVSVHIDQSLLVGHCNRFRAVAGAELDFDNLARPVHVSWTGRIPGVMRSTAGTPREMLIRIDTIDRLFNAPDANPFSDKDADVLGEAALVHMVRQLMGRQLRNWDDVQLTIALPADQLTPSLQQETIAAIQRYSAAKIEDNRLSIHLSRVRGAIGLAIVTLFALVVVGLIYLLMVNVFADATTTVRSLVAGVTSIFAWVVIWTPLEKLLFDWVDPALENRILHKIGAMKIALVSEPCPGVD